MARPYDDEEIYPELERDDDRFANYLSEEGYPHEFEYDDDEEFEWVRLVKS